MRHFAEALRAEGVRVDYVRLDDPDNTHAFSSEVARAVARHRPDQVCVTEPGEWRVWEMMLDWREDLGVPVHIREDDRFFCSRDTFAAWAQDRRQLRMEFFYRVMRRTTGYLMDGDQPEGGQWNFDHENRKALPRGHRLPELPRFAPDAITRAVMDLVAQQFGDHFGALEPFGWAVTRADALTALDAFIAQGLPFFGDFQDAMRTGEDFLYHAALSPYLNCGLLLPRDLCDRADAAYRAGLVPLNAVEGFIRQVIGWREFVRGIYWARMPDYAASNHLRADRPLPGFFWTGDTAMACLSESIGNTRRNAYAHHIQRLMVIGNFALLAGIAPPAIEEWFLIVYADAYEWVELPNVHGMVMHADGGVLGSKPYPASGAYINRMSDYCAGCAYDVKRRTGAGACPFNLLYWRFLAVNAEQLAANPRMALPYRHLANMPEAERDEIIRAGEAFLTDIGSGRARPAD
jgi:deoxyribodipyrimidine photolyase-related protein